MKPWYQSKMVLVNACTAVLAALVAVQGTPLVAAYPALAAVLTAAVGVVNVVLRLATYETIGTPTAPSLPPDVRGK